MQRRDFLKNMGLAAAATMVGGGAAANAAPRKPKADPKPEKVRVALIGIGNRGEQDADEFARTGLIEVTALCDVDLDGKQCQKVLAKYPDAKRFRDFREMFDSYGDHFDAVVAAVPDHIHYPVAMCALRHGKHIYLEKPMTRTFIEAEMLMEAARRRPGVVTQVGNQGHSEGNYFQFKAWKEAGVIKDVTAINAHMNNPRRWHGYDAAMHKLPDAQPVPAGMDWNTWLGACQWHDFSDKYHQGNWRCWYDFGMGALGDWGAHLLDTAHEFLDLGLPYEITLTKQEGHNDFFFPFSSTILFRFGARGSMPPCDVTWYDGIGNLPPLPEGYGESEFNANVPSTNQGSTPVAKLNPGKEIYTPGIVFKGGSHGSTLKPIFRDGKTVELPKWPESPSNHYKNFLLACLGKEKTRSPFEINGVLSQVFCLGVIAQRLNTQLFFDPRTKRFTNNEFANALLAGGLPPRQEWRDLYEPEH